MTGSDHDTDGSGTNCPGSGDSVEHPHDSFFRQLMGKPVVAGEMLRGWLPPTVADGLDWETLVPAPANHVGADLRQTHGDSTTWDAVADRVTKAGLGKEIVMGLAQRTREEGREEGRQKGTRAGAIHMIDRTLVNRFRVVPGSVTGRLEKVATVERLERLFDFVLRAASADEFFAALDSETAP